MSTKILLKNLNSGCDCRTYDTPKGNTYSFYLGMYTEVKDPEDALHFLNAGNGKVFEVEKGPVGKAIDALKKLIAEKEVNEEEEPEESGILNTDEDTPIDGDESIEGLVDGDEAPVEVGEVSDAEPEFVTPDPDSPTGIKEEATADPEETKEDTDKEELEAIAIPAMTSTELKDLNAKQQTHMIKELTTETVPRLESGRIELLLKLQDEGANLPEALNGYVA